MEDSTEDRASTKALYAGLAKFQAAMADVRIVKEKTARIGNQFEYRYADLGAIVSALRKPMGDAGLSFSQAISADAENGAKTTLRTRIYHAEGGYLESIMVLPVGNMKPQEVGSLLTYYRRYALTALAGVVAEDDDDGAMAQDAASKHSAAPSGKTASAGVVPSEELVACERAISDAITTEAVNTAVQEAYAVAAKYNDSKAHDGFRTKGTAKWKVLAAEVSRSAKDATRDIEAIK